MQGLRAIFFDMYNTLARFWPPREEIQAQACRDFGVEVTPEGVARGYALADAFMARENAGPRPVPRRSPQDQGDFFMEYQRLILQGAGVEAEPRLAARVWARVREIPYGLALFDDVLPGLERLRDAGLTLGLISNMDRGGEELAGELGLTGHVEVVVTSREGGRREAPPGHLPGGAGAGGGVAPRGGPRGGPVRVGRGGRPAGGHPARAHGPLRYAGAPRGSARGAGHGGGGGAGGGVGGLFHAGRFVSDVMSCTKLGRGFFWETNPIFVGGLACPQGIPEQGCHAVHGSRIGGSGVPGKGLMAGGGSV